MIKKMWMIAKLKHDVSVPRPNLEKIHNASFTFFFGEKYFLSAG